MDNDQVLSFSPAPVSQPRWHVLLLIAASAGFAQLVSIELWVPTPRVHILWLPGAVLMCGLLALPLRHWWLATAVAWLGASAVLVTLGAPLLASAIMILGHYLLVVPASYLLLQVRGPGEPLESYPWIGMFVAVAGVALPALSASWAVYAARELDLERYLGGWSNIALAHSVSYLLLIPAFLSLRRVAIQPQRRAGWTWQNLALIAALAIAFGFACWLPFAHSPLLRPLLLLVSFTLLIWSLLLFGSAGAFIALLALSLTCMQASSVGASPLPIGGGRTAILAIQLWTIAMTLALLSLAAVAEQRMSLRMALLNAYGRLSDLTGRMLLVQEEERTRIARDLHDDINQSLAAISIQISALKKDLDAPERERLADIQRQILEVSGDIRQLSHDLHPSILRYTSLAASLLALCESHSMDDRLRVECAIHDDMALSNDQKLNLFRITQEAIHNIETHAQASHARVSLSRADNEVVLRVEDNGIGIPEDMRQRIGSGLGMISMEERARSLGGRFSIARRANGGSCLEVHLPLGRDATPAEAGADRLATGSSS